MKRKINFNAGPAEIAPEVLHEAAKAVRKYDAAGLSILELPHRGKEFLDIIDESKVLVRELCGIDDSYEVLWLQGGGRLQFCMVPMNFLPESGSAGYIDSGHWANEAIEYAKYYGDVQVLSSSKDSNYSKLPTWPSKIPAQLAYLHLTTNNTIYGTQLHTEPKTKLPLIADMSSDILSGTRDYTRYSMFYAAAQKNLGAAGVALVVVKKDMLKNSARRIPPMLSYAAHAKENSILNTANVFGMYVSLLTLRWIKETGLERIEKENKRKAELLYNTIDNSRIFSAIVTEEAHRSLMNVCFTTRNPDAVNEFLSFCENNNVTGLKGHRAAGGMRASLYNATPYSSVEVLVDLMDEFEANYQG